MNFLIWNSMIKQLQNFNHFFPGSRLVAAGNRGSAHAGQMAITCQKLNSKNLWKVNGSYLCLLMFDKFWTWSSFLYRKRKFWKLIWKTCEVTLWQTEVNLFLAGFTVLEPLCSAHAGQHGDMRSGPISLNKRSTNRVMKSNILTS